MYDTNIIVINVQGTRSAGEESKEQNGNRCSERRVSKAGFNPNTSPEKYRERKLSTMPYADALLAMDKPVKAQRVKDCGTYLEFSHDGDKTRLSRINSCKSRLCPYCMWRQSRKVAAQISSCMDYIGADEAARFALLTLTQERVSAEGLAGEVDRVLKAWKRLADFRQFEHQVNGFVRAVEITHDTNEKITKEIFKNKRWWCIERGLEIGDLNPLFDTYHVHIHAILHIGIHVSGPLRIKEKKLMLRKKWGDMWQTALGIDYDPVVDIQLFDRAAGHGTFELSKYVSKPFDFLYLDEEHRNRTIAALETALFDRTLVAYSGTFRKARRELEAANRFPDTDIETGTRPGKVSNWWWNWGYSQYIRGR